jgi:hypothetical protein
MRGLFTLFVAPIVVVGIALVLFVIAPVFLSVFSAL